MRNHSQAAPEGMDDLNEQVTLAPLMSDFLSFNPLIHCPPRIPPCAPLKEKAQARLYTRSWHYLKTDSWSTQSPM